MTVVHRAGPAPAFDIAVARRGQEIVVSLSGELDASVVHMGRTALGDLIEVQGNLAVVIDLSRLTFIDSTGLALLVRARRLLAERDGRLVVVSPPVRMLPVLQLAGLHELLSVEELEGGEP